MGLVHTPRVLASIAKGLTRGKARQAGAAVPGVLLVHPHIYHGRVGLFDVDYLGHMNNASYLNHAEYARWQWTAELGFLGAFLKEKKEFIVTSSVIRYRREMKPLFRKFEVQTSICGVNDRTLSVYQTFRYPGQGGASKIRAQVLLHAVIRKGRNVLDPQSVLKDSIGLEPHVIDAIGKGEMSMEEELIKYSELEDLLRETAAKDDRRVDPES